MVFNILFWGCVVLFGLLFAINMLRIIPFRWTQYNSIVFTPLLVGIFGSLIFLSGCNGDNGGNPGGANGENGDEYDDSFKSKYITGNKVTILDTVLNYNSSFCDLCDSVGYFVNINVWWFEKYEGCKNVERDTNDFRGFVVLNMGIDKISYLTFGVDDLNNACLYEYDDYRPQLLMNGNIIKDSYGADASKISFADGDNTLIKEGLKNSGISGCPKIIEVSSKKNIIMYISRDYYEKYFISN